MRENKLKALQKRRYKKTTDSNHAGLIAPNLLEQGFTCTGPDQKWGVDISYIWTAEGWLYLAIVLDLFSRRIGGWATSDRLKKDLALMALNRAIALRRPASGLIQHSDIGLSGLRYATKPFLSSGRMLFRNQAQPCCKTSAMSKVVHRRCESFNGQRTHRFYSRHSLQASCRICLCRQRGDLFDLCFNSLRFLGNLTRKVTALLANQFWQIAVVILDDRFNPLQMPDPSRNWVTKLAEDCKRCLSPNYFSFF